MESNSRILSSSGLMLALLSGTFVAALFAFYLFIDFNGLNTEQGIDRAQISRNISQGKGFTTNYLRPLTLNQANTRAKATNQPLDLDRIQDTYHPPLGPWLNSIPLRFKSVGADWAPDLDSRKFIFPDDRIIAGTAMIFFLMSVVVIFLLLQRVFDFKIAAVTALLMILCDLMWSFSQSGLPQMLMLLLFSSALYSLYRAVEGKHQDGPYALWIVLAGAFFGLLALTQWLAIWLFIGAFLYVAAAMRPRSSLAFLMLAVFIVVITPALARNFAVTGNFHGDALYAIYGGMGTHGETGVMASFDTESQTMELRGLFSRVVLTSIQQLDSLIVYFGSIIAAPIFFLSLLHPFKRKEIASYRWGILLMWIFAVIGMSFFGLSGDAVDPNQLHILFAPIMAGFGIAFLSVLWNRLEIANTPGLLQNGHLIIIVLISAIPAAVAVPRTLIRGGLEERPAYPPYHAPIINKFADYTTPDEVIVSDMPWATAWYAERLSLLLPTNIEQFDKAAALLKDHNRPVAGVFFSPISTDQPLISSIMVGKHRAWSPFILDFQFKRAMFENHRRAANFRYGEYMPFGLGLGFWTNYQRDPGAIRKPTESPLADPLNLGLDSAPLLPQDDE